MRRPAGLVGMTAALQKKRSGHDHFMSSQSDRQASLRSLEFDLHPMQRLTDEEQFRLSLIVQEDHGRGLSRWQFEDCVALLLEDVSGFEVLDTREVSLLIDRLWSAYQRQ
jgi:hypothetical protein